VVLMPTLGKRTAIRGKRACPVHKSHLARKAATLAMSAQIKRPGRELVSIPVELSAVATDKSAEVAPYEHLLTDAMRGVATLFVREDAVEAAWAIVDPVLGDATPLAEYQPGSWGPAEADRLAADVGGWQNPEAA